MNRLANRVAVVTGGASGIGRAMVDRFLAEGASVVIADFHEGNLEKAATSLAEHAQRVRTAVVNVSVEDDVASMVALAVSSFGSIDVLCNNAGIGGAFGSITDVTVSDWDETFAVLVRGVFLGCKHAARVMIEQGSGSIINTASVAGITAGGGPVAYSSAKAAVLNMTRALSLDLAPHRIRVNAIAPGAIQTPLLQQGRRVDMAEVAPRMQPWPEGGRPEDIAATAAFLASDDSRFITGETIVVDGGLLASGPSIWGINGPVPTGMVGMNRGNTGQKPTIHQR